MSIAVLIVTYNSARTIEGCLKSVGEQLGQDDEVVVVDNGSSDGTRTVLSRAYPKANLIESANIGFGAGMNLARKAAAANWILVLNPDAFLVEGCLETLRQHKDPSIIYAPMQLDEAGKEKGAGRAADVFGFPVDERWFTRIFYADGAAIFLSAQLFDALGGFDEAGFLFCEDLDLSWRAWLRGSAVRGLPDAKVIHGGGESIVGGRNIGQRRITSTMRRYYTEFNTIRYLIRNYSVPVLLPVLFIYLVLLSAEMGLLILTRNITTAGAVFRAFLANLSALPSTLRARRIVQAQRRVSDRAILARRFFGSGKLLLFLEVGMPKFRA